MATMVLKDTIKCSKCGLKMFPSKFDKDAIMITYKCSACGAISEENFDAVKLSDNERYSYFCLNDDGDATWKCFTHGYCEFPINSLFEYNFSKFQRCCCILGKDEDEIMADLEYADGEGKEKIKRILAAIDGDQIPELAGELLLDVDVDCFEGDYLEAFTVQAKINEDGVDNFIYEMLDRIAECFGIILDEDGNLQEE